MTVTSLIREALETFLGVRQRRVSRAAAARQSGRDDISERIEEILRGSIKRGVEHA